MKKSKNGAAHHHENLTHHARALVTATEHIAEDKVAQARAKLSALVDDAKEGWEHLEEKTMDSAKQVDEFVREKPYHAVALGMGVGALLGLFFARRK
jgi:ElaB/YqjD/DUF883 family membrane-anchored ribosome-binding protein